MPSPTPFADLNGVLGKLVDSVRAVLGDNLVGVYLQGSFALGDYDAHSDVDFLVAIEHDLSPVELRELGAMHEWLYGHDTEWAKRLEGSYVPADRLRDYRRAGGELAYVDNGATVIVFSDHCDTAVVRWTTREYGITLIGPDPKTLIDPVSPEALRAEVRALMRKWVALLAERPETMDSLWSQTFAVVMICRLLQTLETGRVHSKRTGFAWAIQTLDPRWHGLIERAWARRPQTWEIVFQAPDPTEIEATREFAAFALRMSGIVD